jgi:hypothetical protein
MQVVAPCFSSGSMMSEPDRYNLLPAHIGKSLNVVEGEMRVPWRRNFRCVNARIFRQ